VLLGFVIGAIFMIVSDEDVLRSLDPARFDFFGALVGSADVVGQGYGALIRGSIFNFEASRIEAMVRPLTETLRLATPLVLAGLGVALGFRAGLFNIGGTGQLAFGLIWGGFVATKLSLPFGLHLIVAVIAAVLGAAAYGALAGFLKARTGAHEVIVTIMLNFIALNLLTWMLREPSLLKEPGETGNPKSSPAAETAVFPRLLGDEFSLHAGFLVALAAVFAFWWLMERSTIGFRLRMVGFNPNAARTAGIKVERSYVLALALSGAFVGLAAANQALGSTTSIIPSTHANIGFDAITVALLGGSTAPGVLLAGLLLGAFKAGGPTMQSVGVSPEVLGIVQGAIVLFIAAPPLIRLIFRLPQPGEKRAKQGEK
jgi:simple sugar transport system permease protein